MNVLFVTPFYHPESQFGGPPKRIHAISLRLIERNHSVEVVTFNSAQQTGERVQVDGVPVRYISWRGKNLRQIPAEIEPILAAVSRAEVVHCYGLYNLLCPLASLACKFKSVPYLVEPMGMIVPRVHNFLVKRFYNAFFTRPMARYASAIVATSAVERNDLYKSGLTQKIVIRRNGVDTSEFVNTPQRRTEARKYWRLEARERLIAYIGRISAKKNIVELIRAFGAVDKGLKLLIAGPVSEPRYYETLQREIRQNRRGSDIQLHGPLYGEELRIALAATDLFVLPSVNENFGNSASEAVAAGVPVLLTETCGVAPLIHKRAGLAVPLGSESLREGLRIMLDPVRCKDFMVDQEGARRDLSWDVPIQQTEDLYREIIRNVNGQFESNKN